jgi:hypothetical protein
MTKHREHNNAHPAIRGYLVLYNAVQGIGWSLCLAACLDAAFKGQDYQSVFLAGSVYASECTAAAGAAVWRTLRCSKGERCSKGDKRS